MRLTIALLHAAAKMLETDGTEGFRSAVKLVGNDVALTLLIAQMRCRYGSIDTYPANPEIDGKVNEFLEGELSDIYLAMS